MPTPERGPVVVFPLLATLCWGNCLAADTKPAKAASPQGRYFVTMLPLNPPGLVQHLTLKPKDKTPYPLVVGTSFSIQAASDAGLEVQVALLAGKADEVPGAVLHTWNPTKAGKLVFEATQKGDQAVAPARPTVDRHQYARRQSYSPARAKRFSRCASLAGE